MMIGSRVFLASAAAALLAVLPGNALAAQCAPVHVTVGTPRAGITAYAMPQDRKYGEERALGPDAIGVAADGTVWFTFELSEAPGVATLRNGNIQRCSSASVDAAGKAFAQATGLSAKYVAPAIQPAVPPGGSVYMQAVAPNGVTWFTLQYIGRDGNPAKGGRLGSIDKAKHVRIFQIPGSGEMVSIAVAKDGIIWLGDYYNEQIIEVDPSKL
ncbi:MAG TPA: hypothetical protein VK760_09535 [Candidatus Acidoferrales bacterium]|jgi:streptogramin lyase|nr:hypothetical protein [Candidatus Acidoferrales bacterium]